MQVEGAVVVVTGSAAGLGRATARRLKACGAQVVEVDLHFPQGEATGRERATADVTDADQVETALRKAAHTFGRVDAVVHCAGVAAGFRLIDERGPADPAAFQRVVDVNLVGTFNVARAAALVMSQNPAGEFGRGVVVLTASVAAFEGQRGQTAYAATKAGVVGMTLPIARDLADYGIRCVTIAPGAFETALTTDLTPWLQDKLVSYTTFPRRLGKPEEFAGLVHAVIENDMLNAEVIRLDAGTRLPSL
ncbi:SDR family NAD(P)-dependent oxidoreductase [Prauserella flavalba]|uniref:SDR family NAD(P)-dependent oxidoreductase n=1 Tax=Prauserella flavalba TaxID=1477506 RepID=UPI0036F1287C